MTIIIYLGRYFVVPVKKYKVCVPLQGQGDLEVLVGIL